MPLRILVADDHDLIREGTRTVIEEHKGWEVCGTASTGREAVEKALELKPDVVVMDMIMPELSGLEAAIRIKRELPGTEVLIFTGYVTEQLVRDAFEGGVKSVISKSGDRARFLAAIDSLSRHKPFLTDSVSKILFESVMHRGEGDPDTAQPAHRLSTREREIAQLLCEGKSNKEVADALHISVRTVEAHRASLLRKLEVDSIAGLVRYAIRNKIIEP